MVDARNRNNQYANIALRAAKNVFTSGMNMDADLVNMPQSAYRMATDFRLTVTNDGTMGSLENIRGNTLLVNSFLGTIVGSVVVDNDVIILTHSNDANNISRIYRITFTGETLSACTLLYSDESYGTEDKLNLSVSYQVKMISRKESTDIEKIYWVDGNNYLRFANIAKPLTTDGEPYVFGVNDYFSAKKFGIVADVKFTTPVMTGITSGGLNVGMVQYSYQLYNKNGAETSFAPATGLYHIVSSSEYLATSFAYKGNAAEEESGKAYSFTITLPADSYEYDSIRVVSLHYTTYGQLPVISIIVEKPINSTGVVSFTDTGSGYSGTYTPEQFSVLSHLYKASDIESNKNYLFLANVTEDYFDIGTYDARAYRFSSTETRAYHYEADGHIYALDKGASFGTWRYGTLDGLNFIVEDADTSLETIPATADLINYYNDSSLDGSRTGHQELKYKSDGVTLGGEGANISYTFGIGYIYPDDGASSWKIQTTTRSYNPEGAADLGYSGYYAPNYSAHYRTYELDETYRFAIVFTDKYGRDSVANWIGDIRMPSMDDITTLAAYDPGTGGWGNYLKLIQPLFSVNTYPTDAVSYRIVRVERASGDKSVVCSGMLRPTLYYGTSKGTGIKRHAFHAYADDGVATQDWVRYDLQEFISPEISFYKSLQILGNDYIQVYNLPWSGESITEDCYSHVANNYNARDINIKYRKVTKNTSRVVLPIQAGKVIQTMEIDESDVVGDYEFYGFYNNRMPTGDDEKGYKTTSLIFQPTSATNIYGVTTNNESTYKYVKYGVYRRDIYSSQYGGYTYSDRSDNEYIAASKNVTIPVARTSTLVYASIGDMYAHMYEHAAITGWGEQDNVFLNFMFPVYSSINIALRHDDVFSRVYSRANRNYLNIREEGNIYYNLSQLFLYNTVYSQESNIKKYYPLPEGEEFEATEYFNTRIIVSEKKINGESSDSWLQFLTNNFIDVDANYGSITNILTYNNNLLYWQPKGFGSVDVNPRSLITDNSGASLVVGTGDVLTRFDYISTLTGNSDRFGLINAVKGVYWYDSINKTINRFNGESIERLSKLKGVQSYLNDNAYTTTITGYDVKNDELLFTLGDTATLCYNEMVDAFTAFYSFVPVRYITVGGKLLTTETNTDLFIHASTSAYGSFYGNATPYTSNLTVLVNELIDYAKTFDVLNYQSYSYNNNVLNYLDTFDRATFYTSYQNSYSVTLVPGTNVERKIGMWSMFIARNLVNPAPEDNPDIFDIANRNPNKPYKERLRDTHMYINLEYDNSNNYRLVLPYLKTKYRISHR